MKIFTKLKKYASRLLPFGVVGVMAIGMVSFIRPADALTLPTSCNDAPNEVLWCGAATPQKVLHDYTYGDGHNSQQSIQNIYGWSGFGITSADVHSMPSTAVAGTVTSTGNVYVGGRLVATGAYTAGRDFIPGSTQENSHGTIFYERPTHVSFLQHSLDAFVVMQNGQFSFAILSSCGNPVSGKPTPAPKPDYTINKTVAYIGSNNYQKSIVVKPDSSVKYRVQIDSTGKADVTNLHVEDILPKDVQYTSGTLTLNGNHLNSSDVSKFFAKNHNGLDVGTLAVGKSDIFDFTAVVGPNMTDTNCVTETLNNTAYMIASNLPLRSSHADVSIKCIPPKPKYPNYTINKEVAPAGSNNYQKNITVKPGSTVDYRIVVNSTGQADVQGLVVKDSLPIKVNYKSGTLTLNGHTVSTTDAAKFFANGLSLPNLAPGQSDQFNFSAVVGAKMTSTNCQTGPYPNTATMTATQLPSKSSTAIVNVKCIPPKPRPKTPNYTITKQVAIDGTNNYGPDVVVNPNTKVDYKIVITSTGTVKVTGLMVKDILASDLQYVTGTLEENGTAVSSSNVANFFAGGLQLGSLAPGSSDTFTYVAIAGANQNNPNCVAETLPNYAIMTADHLPKQEAEATVSVNCVPVTPTPTPTPTPPSSLVNTGPGNMIGVFIGISVSAAAGYSLLLRRKMYRNS